MTVPYEETMPLFEEIAEHMNDALGPLNHADSALEAVLRIAAMSSSPAGNAVEDIRNRVAQVQTLVAELRNDATRLADTLRK